MEIEKNDKDSILSRRVTFRVSYRKDPINFGILQNFSTSALNTLAHALLIQYLNSHPSVTAPLSGTTQPISQKPTCGKIKLSAEERDRWLGL